MQSIHCIRYVRTVFDKIYNLYTNDVDKSVVGIFDLKLSAEDLIEN